MADLKDKIVRAHGGPERWQGLNGVMASCSLGGLEFAPRLHLTPLRHAEVHLHLDSNRLTISPFPEPGLVAVFTPEQVWIENKQGERISERRYDNGALRGLRHWLLWDQLDVIYYAGSLLWQALHLPFCLLGAGCQTEALEPQESGGERWQRLLVRQPAMGGVPAQEQVIYADPTGLIRRMDYAPVYYGAMFRVAQLWDQHESFSGLVYSTRRTVHPCLATGHAWRLTTLAWMELDDVTPLKA